MERTSPDFLGDGGHALLMSPEPSPESFPGPERPQGEELRFLQDPKKPLDRPAPSGTELQEDAFYGAEEPAAASREGKGPELRDDSDFFSSLARHEPDVALEAHDEADEPDPALSGAVPELRPQLGPSPADPLPFPPALFRPELRSAPGAVPWDSRPESSAAGDGTEESTLGTPKNSPESPFALRPRLEPEPPPDDDRNSAPESPLPEIPEEKYPRSEPKRAEKRPEKSRRSVQRLEWISRTSRTPSPPYGDPQKSSEASEFRGPAPSAFRKSKPSRKSDAELGSDWALPKIGKRSWTVNVAEDSSELSLEPCGSFEVELRPYVLLEEPEKDSSELIPEDDPDVFTCIECSIYFRKKEHLMEHMVQHSRGDGDGDAAGPRFSCGECGWAFGDPESLDRHRRLHQESREKIIEEIQKLNEFPDEGRDARLQCPKCVFGTNSSKIFVQHAKMHVRERKDHGSRNSNLFGEDPYKSFKAEELPGRALSSCVLCGFPAPTEHILKEHMTYAHSHFSWDLDTLEDDPNQPGTSRDSYSPARSGRFSDLEFFGKTERIFPPQSRESSSHYDPAPPPPPPPGFGISQPRSDRSDGITKKEHQGLGFHARKAAPYSRNLGIPAFPSSKAYSHLRKRAGPEGDADHLGGHPWGLEEDEMDLDVATRTTPVATNAISVPQAALELKRTFRNALRNTEVTSEEQQHQLRMMVPVVLLQEVTPKSTKRPRGKPYKKKLLPPPPPPPPPPPREFLLEEPLPLDVLLLDTPLEGPLELDELLDPEAAMLKNEERKCPYCPDRFHNGIGLANHVRGHLNRVGVSYNVRHFISAEEVKAIEQKFSFQKKKKKVANFDPSTFSLMRCEFCGAGFDTRAGLSSHARAHLRDFGITNWELTVSPINILKELLANSSEHPALLRAALAADEPHAGAFGARKFGSLHFRELPLPGWGEEALQSYRDVLAPPEDDVVPMDISSSPAVPKKPPGSVSLEPPPARIGTKLSPEPPGSKAEPQDSKAPSLTTCEVCGACFETRKGLSSHARSHLRQLGVAESESSGAPIDLLYELVRHKSKPDASSSCSSSSSSLPPPPLAKKSASPKEPSGISRPLLLLSKEQRPPPAEGAVNKAIKSPPGFSKSLSQPGSPVLKKVPAALSGSPSPKNSEEKGSKLALSPLPAEPKAQWAPDEDGPLNLTSGSEPSRDIRCEFCGEFFENRKGLSSHARSHLRQMGVTEWYVNGSPIDTLREILKRRRNPSNPPGSLPKSMAKSLLGSLAPLEPPRAPGEIHIPTLGKKIPSPLSAPGPPPANSPPPPTARKMFPGLSAAPFPKKLKQDQLRVEIKRELMAGGGGNGGIVTAEAPAPPDPAWAPREEMAPLNLSSRADPVRDIRCEFCGEFFENRKGLSSHARSHLRQMGVTEWSVNGSPIDTLREILRKKSKPCLIKKEPQLPPAMDAPKVLGSDDGVDPKISPSALPPGLALAPLGGRPGKSGSSGSSGLALAPLGSKNPGAFLAPKRALPEERLGSAHGEAKHKAFGPAELSFKAKALHDKASEACCELCGLYFENRKALASHARAHLRQFGVTEWCVNGSPIETLREWIRHRPHKAGAYRSYIQGGRPFSKKFRNSGHPREHRGALGMQAGVARFLGKGIAADAGDAAAKGLEGSGAELGAALVVKVEEQRANISKFERRQARPLEPSLSRDEDPGQEFAQKLQEPRPPPPRVRPVPALVPRPPQTSLVKFVGNIYTLKCRFCEVEFQGPLSIQEEWVRHLQRHILDMNFSKSDPLRTEAPPDPPALTETP